MASLHELRGLPAEGEYFLSFEDLLEVIRDAFVKHKFSFRVPHKDPKRAWYRCTNKQCLWTVNAHINKENNNEIIVDKVISEHTCIGDQQAKRGAASCQEWIQKVMARHMDVKPTRSGFHTIVQLVDSEVTFLLLAGGLIYKIVAEVLLCHGIEIFFARSYGIKIFNPRLSHWPINRSIYNSSYDPIYY
jgi:hypothetical protein